MLRKRGYQAWLVCVVFNQQAEAAALEGEEHWPLGQFEPGRAATVAQASGRKASQPERRYGKK